MTAPTATGYRFAVTSSASQPQEGDYSPLLPIATHLIKDISNLADGTLFLHVQAVGPGGNTANVTESWIKDTVPPGAFTITGPTGTQSTSKPVITWTAAEGVSSYRIDITSDDACENIYKSYTNITGTSFQIVDGLANGFWHICIKAMDAASNATPATNNGTLLTVDAPFHYIFATSTVFRPTEIGFLDGADDQVTLHAFIGNLIPDWNGVDRIYRALLSTSTVDARDRFVLNRSIFNRNNQLVTFGEDLWDGNFLQAVNYDENGSLLGPALVWTGSNPNGTWSGFSADDWTNNSSDATAGNVSSLSSTWISSGTFSGNNSFRIYAIGPF